VDAIEVVAWRSPILSLLIECRSGTYIRSIARDLGSAVGCPAHLSSLVRLRVGLFDITDSVRVEAVELLRDQSDWGTMLWPVDTASPDLDVILVSAERRADFAHGRGWPITSSAAYGEVRAYDEYGSYLGLAEATEGGWQPRLAVPAGGGTVEQVT